MKTINHIMFIAFSLLLMLGITSCEQKKASVNDSNSQSEVIVKEKTEEVSVEQSNTASAPKGKMVIIDFYATWCGPCKAMTPVMNLMEEKYGNKFEFKKVDIDQESDLAQQYNIEGVPTLVVLSPDNKVITTIVGYRDADELGEILNNL